MEEWKDIKDYEGYYQISNLGRVKSFFGNKEKIRKLNKDQKGYLRVSLTKNKVRNTQKVHRLVANHFIPNPQNKPQVNHINSIKHDNRLENLEWCTQKENMQHCVKYGSKKREYNIKGIIRDYKNGVTVTNITKKHKISYQKLLKIFPENGIIYYGQLSSKKGYKHNEENIIKLYINGQTLKQVGLQHNICGETVRKILINNNINRR